MRRRYFIFLISIIALISCDNEVQEQPLFQLLSNEEIGIDFINQLEYDQDFNVYKYRNYYNGGGVALGDVNNDGLTDIYFTANLKKNKLYLNLGNNKFKDVSDSSGVEGSHSWSTGVTMVDINGDNYLDIYVCNSGDIEGDNKENELFINNGDLTFSELSEEYGLNDDGFSTHASFFDYDKDGDLDVYLLNNSYQAIGSFNLRIDERPNRDKEGGDKFLRNDDGIFVDVSDSAGIFGSVIGFGLGITVGDVNNDNWEDIYVSNDFFERDYLYINQQNGTFSEVLTEQMISISGASMGADMADIDNDGNADIFVTEMLPSDPQRLKTVTTFEDWNKYQYNVKNGYHHQFTRNTLQYNNGDGTFSEVGRYAGVEASDWSWGALFFDMDNDGLKDLFIANGIYQDLTNQDYLQYVANEKVIKSIINDDGVNYKELIDIIPSNPVPNHFYINKNHLSFDRLHQNDLDIPSFSNGAAYGDLDNDGDLDLVVSNVNMPPFIYQNQSSPSEKHRFISVVLEGSEKNRKGIGSIIRVTSDNGLRIEQQVQPARGFQSSMDQKIVIGVGNARTVDIEVNWPNLTKEIIKDVSTNQEIVIQQKNITASIDNEIRSVESKIFSAINPLSHIHQENIYSDFNRERLIYHMKSNLSPHLAIGDLDNNGFEDLVITGSKGYATNIFFQDEDGFREAMPIGNEISREQEHSDLLLFDANGNGHLDIYFASGGVDVSPFSPYLFDELWINNGSGEFSKSDQQLPNLSDNISSSVVIGNDFDKDGDVDLFVGERVKIGKYGAPCSGYILQNDGKGNFSDVTAELAPSLQNIGMINDATFSDIDGNGNKEIIIVGEFMKVSVLEWSNGKFVKKEIENLTSLSGWYNVVYTSDLNNDGLPEILLGNHGTNSRFKASEERPLKMYFNDFDKNGFPEGILTETGIDGKDYPFTLRHNLLDQLKYLKKKFPDFKSYQSADIETIFTKDELQGTQVFETIDMETRVLINKGDLIFEKVELPKEAQFAPIYAITTGDFDKDGDIDIVFGGNQHHVLPEAGIYDASHGVFLENESNASFKYRSPQITGLLMNGQIRDFVSSKGELYIARNNEKVLIYKY